MSDERVQRVHVLEDDRLHLGRSAGVPALQAVQHRLAEAPLHDRMDGRELLLDLVWMRAFSSSMLRCTAMAKSGSTSRELGRWRGVEVARVRASRAQRADDSSW